MNLFFTIFLLESICKIDPYLIYLMIYSTHKRNEGSSYTTTKSSSSQWLPLKPKRKLDSSIFDEREVGAMDFLPLSPHLSLFPLQLEVPLLQLLQICELLLLSRLLLEPVVPAPHHILLLRLVVDLLQWLPRPPLPVLVPHVHPALTC